MSTDRFDRAIDAIDAANAEDPAGRELRDAVLATAWVRRLRPDASEPLLLAVRAHHIRRWKISRHTYPDGRTGYLRWRRAMHDHHAAEASRILEEHGYDAATIARTGGIIHKLDLAHDADVQTLEDALCLVFLETQFDELAARLDEAKMIEVVRKTLRKMSAAGKTLALGMKLSASGRALVAQALACEGDHS